MSDAPHHDDIDAMALDQAGGHYQYWVARLTADDLHAKSDIARVLAWYRADLARVTAEREAMRDAVIGWRECDWPEGFDRRTAELIADHVRAAQEKGGE